jgi:hypothetical protein
MQTDSTVQYPYTGDYYSYTVVTSADGLVSNNVYSEYPVQVKMMLSTNLLGDLLIKSSSKMQLNGHIANIVDKAGEQIYTDGEWNIFQTAPILGSLGLKGGYQYRAKLISGQI